MMNLDKQNLAQHTLVFLKESIALSFAKVRWIPLGLGVGWPKCFSLNLLHSMLM